MTNSFDGRKMKGSVNKKPKTFKHLNENSLKFFDLPNHVHFFINYDNEMNESSFSEFQVELLNGKALGRKSI